MTEENPRQNVTFASNGGHAHGYLSVPASGSGPGGWGVPFFVWLVLASVRSR